jgi:hypothetical protein
MAGTARIPEWFEHQSKGPSISFWFRNKIPSIALFVVSKSMDDKSLQSEFHSQRVIMFVNGDQYFLDERNGVYRIIEQDHTYLYDLHLQGRNMEKSLLKNEWNHVKVMYKNKMMIPVLIESGIHVFKYEGSMEDVQFTNPIDDDDDDDDDYDDGTTGYRKYLLRYALPASCLTIFELHGSLKACVVI